MTNLLRTASIAVMCLTSLVSCKEKEQAFKFAVASDFHAPDVPDGKERVQAFIDSARANNVDFIIELGDFCRLDSVSEPIVAVWDSFTGERYHVIGNHDMDNYNYNEYVTGMNMPGRYYSFDKGDFHFIILDSNNIYDGETYTHYANANYYIDSKMREFMDPEQLDWLKKDIAATDKKCILFSHASIDRSVNNGETVRSILEGENNRVGHKKIVMALSGHDHSNYVKEINGISYVQINSASYVWIGDETMTEKRYPAEVNDKYSLLKYSITYDKPVFAIVSLTSDGASIKGTQANFMPPTPQELGLDDSRYDMPLVSSIEDAEITF